MTPKPRASIASFLDTVRLDYADERAYWHGSPERFAWRFIAWGAACGAVALAVMLGASMLSTPTALSTGKMGALFVPWMASALGAFVTSLSVTIAGSLVVTWCIDYVFAGTDLVHSMSKMIDTARRMVSKLATATGNSAVVVLLMTPLSLTLVYNTHDRATWVSPTKATAALQVGFGIVFIAIAGVKYVWESVDAILKEAPRVSRTLIAAGLPSIFLAVAASFADRLMTVLLRAMYPASLSGVSRERVVSEVMSGTPIINSWFLFVVTVVALLVIAFRSSTSTESETEVERFMQD